MGVWIETMRHTRIRFDRAVTPCMGVWIETTRRRNPVTLVLSHPVWVCGLKLVNPPGEEETVLSHPVWVCGLKLLRVASET